MTNKRQESLSLGGNFVLSDDSHGTAQIATCYRAALQYIQAVGITELAVFDFVSRPADLRFKAAAAASRPIEKLIESAFFKSLT